MFSLNFDEESTVLSTEEWMSIFDLCDLPNKDIFHMEGNRLKYRCGIVTKKRVTDTHSMIVNTSYCDYENHKQLLTVSKINKDGEVSTSMME